MDEADYDFDYYGDDYIQLDLDFEKQYSEIHRLIRDKNYEEGFEFILILLRTLVSTEEELKNYHDDYSEELNQIFQLLKTIPIKGLSKNQKEYLIHLMLKILADTFSEQIFDELTAMIFQLVQKIEEKEYLHELIASMIIITKDWKIKNYDEFEHTENLIYVYTKNLFDLKKEEASTKLLSNYYLKDEELCILLIELFEQQQKEREALELVRNYYKENNVPNTYRLEYIRKRLIQKVNPTEFIKELVDEYVKTGKHTVYNEIKLFSGRTLTIETRDLILKKLRAADNWILLDFLAIEQMNKELLQEVQRSNDLVILANYTKILKDEYPKELYKQYKALLPGYVTIKKDKKHYKEIVDYLQLIKKLQPKKNDFKQFLNLLKEHNKRKKYLIGEINKISNSL